MSPAREQEGILLDPVARNTAAAMALAALHAEETDYLLFCPADQHSLTLPRSPGR